MASPNAETVVGGVDTHKDLHVAAAVDRHDKVLGVEYFPTTRHGYKQLVKWQRSFGHIARIGVECTGTYGAGLLRYLQAADIEVLEVTGPDKDLRRRKGKDDTLDAENAAHAAYARVRAVTPKTRDGLVESLRVLKVSRKSAVAARRIALQMIRMNIMSTPDDLCDQLLNLTRMKLIRTLAAWRPDLTRYRDVTGAYKIALKSLARRYLELNGEVADLDVMIKNIVDHLATELIAKQAVDYESAAQLLITAGDNTLTDSLLKPRLLRCVGGQPHLCIFRENASTSAEPWRGPTSKLSPPHHRGRAIAYLPTHSRLCCQKTL